MIFYIIPTLFLSLYYTLLSRGQNGICDSFSNSADPFRGDFFFSVRADSPSQGISSIIFSRQIDLARFFWDHPCYI